MTTQEVQAYLKEEMRRKTHDHRITHKGERVRVPAHMTFEDNQATQHNQRGYRLASNGERVWSF